MKRIYVILTRVFLAMVCLAVLWVQGDTLTVETYGADVAKHPETLRVTLEQEKELVRIKDQWTEGNLVYVTLEATGEVLPAGRNRVFVKVSDAANPVSSSSAMAYVHMGRIVTSNEYFGGCTGGWVIPVCMCLYLCLLFVLLLRRYRRDMARNLYQSRNIANLGLLVYLGFLIVLMLLQIPAGTGVIGIVRAVLGSADRFSIVTFPVAFIVSVMAAASNFRLMRREGRTWRNMLGVILGAFFCLSIIGVTLVENYLYYSADAVIDVHNLSGWGYYTFLFVKNAFLGAVVYLEMLLIATVVLGFKAARRIPAFDKDYILILGSRIMEDGTLTRLLQGRADRAVEFAKMQKKAAGKDLVFVPSGGKGSDEVMAEGDAIAAYLRGIGIPEEQILVENRSVNTQENFRNSVELIREREGGKDAKIAFSTTNYHVLRSGMIATAQGVRAEGIGSATKRYFWVNAFVREYIATLASEKRRNAKVLAVVLVMITLMVALEYVSMAVL
ncbi:MAG: YdcF family protein [Lachnospiraceae bacterium]|nr:YdcF family protein [Lachnospiraceae bacterium]